MLREEVIFVCGDDALQPRELLHRLLNGVYIFNKLRDAVGVIKDSTRDLAMGLRRGGAEEKSKGKKR